VRSAKARKFQRFGLLAVCGLLLVGVASGCQTTQETAAKKQAESKLFLKEREAKRAKKQSAKKKEKQ
jgi:hypothetical protein